MGNNYLECLYGVPDVYIQLILGFILHSIWIAWLQFELIALLIGESKLTSSASVEWMYEILLQQCEPCSASVHVLNRVRIWKAGTVCLLSICAYSSFKKIQCDSIALCCSLLLRECLESDCFWNEIFQVLIILYIMFKASNSCIIWWLDA